MGGSGWLPPSRLCIILKEPWRETTTEIFDRIAPGWYDVRHWSIFRVELEALARRWRQGRLVNLGCAHGPDFLPFAADFDLHGVDFSAGMLRQGGRYQAKFGFSAGLVRADVGRLPFADESFDWAISVATYHHLPREKQAAAFAELYRVLSPSGEAFITVWNRRQPRFWLRRKETVVPWRSRGQTLPRYYYLFSRGELARRVREAGFRVLDDQRRCGDAGRLDGSRCRGNSCRPRLKGGLFSRNVCLLVTKERAGGAATGGR